MRHLFPSGSNGQALRELTLVQYLYPHTLVAQAAITACDRQNRNPEYGGQAIASAHVEPQVAIGRLSRGQMVELGSVLDRIWMETTPLQSVSCSV